MAVETVVLLSCDLCKKGSKVHDAKDLPPNWLRLERGVENGDPKGHFDICSLTCLGKWTRGQRNLGAVEGEVRTCEICGKEFNRRGYAPHMKMHERETAP